MDVNFPMSRLYGVCLSQMFYGIFFLDNSQFIVPYRGEILKLCTIFVLICNFPFQTSEDLTSILSNTSFIAPKPPTQSTDTALDKEALTQLAQDAEKLEKVVETLTTKTLSGPTPLDAKWKELTDLQVWIFFYFSF